MHSDGNGRLLQHQLQVLHTYSILTLEAARHVSIAEDTCKAHCMPDCTKGALANCIPKLCLLSCICYEAAVTPDTKSKAQN